jgi:hypothetical protein
MSAILISFSIVALIRVLDSPQEVSVALHAAHIFECTVFHTPGTAGTDNRLVCQGITFSFTENYRVKSTIVLRLAPSGVGYDKNA